MQAEASYQHVSNGQCKSLGNKRAVDKTSMLIDQLGMQFLDVHALNLIKTDHLHVFNGSQLVD
jgi:hypothetical protein